MRSKAWVIMLSYYLVMAPGWCLEPKELESVLSSETLAYVTAEKLIDAGRYAEADRLLATALARYPNNDALLVLRGQALFFSDWLEDAERYLMKALQKNPHNDVAKSYIEVIRQVKQYRISQEEQEWMSIARDKMGDFVILVIGIWLGTTLNIIGQNIAKWRYRKKSRKAFTKGEYQDLSDLVEQQLVTHHYAAVRESLNFMLDKSDGGQGEVRKILQEYVDHPDNRRMLEDMLLRLVRERERKAQNLGSGAQGTGSVRRPCA